MIDTIKIRGRKGSRTADSGNSFFGTTGTVGTGLGGERGERGATLQARKRQHPRPQGAAVMVSPRFNHTGP